jgi:hypothetical protein
VSAIEAAVVAPLRAGTRGFDINRPLTAATARAFKMHGYEFAYRYIWRDHPRPNDLTAAEIETILGAGLGLGIVQHYSGDGWIPSATLGGQYGASAAAALESLRVPRGAAVFCDLEGVASGTPNEVIEDYARAWSFVLASASRRPRGLYVGWGSRLGADALYRLPFELYWRALNLNDDQIPARRGFCMRQHEATAADIPPGLGLTTADFDVNTVSGDSLGGLPSVLVPGGVLA